MALQLSPFLYEQNEAFRQKVLGGLAQEDNQDTMHIAAHYQRAFLLFQMLRLEKQGGLDDDISEEMFVESKLARLLYGEDDILGEISTQIKVARLLYGEDASMAKNGRDTEEDLS
ncbi:MAG: hypothetical protein M3Z08_07295 [Chloroflexota bacterium]|nr:hypothetical protein [Chloroflexota bacterium]